MRNFPDGATLAAEINAGIENIGARRRQPVMEKLVEEISFSASERDGDSERQQGAISLAIEAGRIRDPKTRKFVEVGPPCGSRQRLNLAHFNLAALRESAAPSSDREYQR